MDLVVKLRELRRMRGLRQKDVARRSGLGIKTISSFETGDRIGSMKVSQLERLLHAYGMSVGEFFSGRLDHKLTPWACDEDQLAAETILDELGDLPPHIRHRLLSQFRTILTTTRGASSATPHIPRQIQADWDLMVSRN